MNEQNTNTQAKEKPEQILQDDNDFELPAVACDLSGKGGLRSLSVRFLYGAQIR
jgi:hypothetical protein